MQARNPCQVVAGKIVDDFEVGAERNTRIQPFKQIVAEQCVVGHPAAQRPLECVDVVDAFADVAAFTKKVLIHIRHRSGVRVETDVSRKHERERRRRRADRADGDARLKHGIAFGDTARAAVEAGAIQRVRKRADELASGVERQVGVGVERDDIADALQLVALADEDVERRIDGAPQHSVELVQLAPFPLKPHPQPLGWVPYATPVQQVEAAGPISRVETGDEIEGHIDHFPIRFNRFRVGVGKIAEQREPEVLVVIGERAHFERVDQLLDAAGRRQDGWNGDDRPQFVGDAVAQRKLRQRPRRNQCGEDRVQEAERQLRNRQNGHERDERDHPWRRAVVARVEQQARLEQQRGYEERAEVSDGRVLEHQARDALTDGWRVPNRLLELESPARDQVVADVMRTIGVRPVTARLLRRGDGPLGDLELVRARAP